MEVRDVALEKWPFLVDSIESYASSALDPQSKLPRAASINADNLGGNAEVVQVRRLCTSGIDIVGVVIVDLFPTG
jgi:hypothetical protein